MGIKTAEEARRELDMAWNERLQSPWVTWNSDNSYYVQPNYSNHNITTYGSNTVSTIKIHTGDQELTVDLTKKKPQTEVEKMLGEVEAVCDLAR